MIHSAKMLLSDQMVRPNLMLLSITVAHSFHLSLSHMTVRLNTSGTLAGHSSLGVAVTNQPIGYTSLQWYYRFWGFTDQFCYYQPDWFTLLSLLLIRDRWFTPTIGTLRLIGSLTVGGTIDYNSSFIGNGTVCFRNSFTFCWYTKVI